MLSIMILLLIASITPPSFSSPFSPPRKNSSFQAPIIHRSSPLSPFYDPNATPADLRRESIQSSLARAHFLKWLISSNTSVQAPIMFEPPIEYVMSYYVDNPPAKTYGVMVTGSRLIWLQGELCLRCHEQKIPIFDPSLSSSYKQVLCYSHDVP
ncbi:hypothetical protein L1049_022322 [Liquidambar formosana]|uniref:Peptidase A1 domain-containing protein n=1 Tax=Liquidambar formosana TaxID=63359 RepID=A0AAP0WNY3_LIQFO